MTSPNKVTRWAICKGVSVVYMTPPNKVNPLGHHLKVCLLCLCLLLIKLPAGPYVKVYFVVFMTSPNKVTRWAICKGVYFVFMTSRNKVTRWAKCKGVFVVFHFS